ncbi:unnamed protein product [Gadus morhua 'NCC']
MLSSGAAGLIKESASGALKRVMEKAASTLPDIQVVISTLLPRQDFHPVLIQRHSLYDQVHIFRSEVPTFAKTLKDVALNRQPNTSHRTSRAMGIPPRPAQWPPCIQRPPHSKKSPSPQTA